MIDKKATTILLLVSIIFNLFASVSFAKNNTAIADLGENKYDGIAAVSMGNNAKTTVAERGSRRGWLLSSSAKCFYIDLNKDFLSQIDDGTEISISVEYFDQDDGRFIILYDGLDNERSICNLVSVKNTNQWKTKTFVIDDAYFGKRLDGHDIKISISEPETDNKSSADVVIGKITINKAVAKNPIRAVITTEEAGNIFGNGDKKAIKVSYHNFSKITQEPNVVLEAVKSNGDVVWSGSDAFIIESKADIEKEYELEIDEYAVYDFKVTISDNEKGIYTTTSRTFSFVNSDPDGITNPDFQYCVHYSWMGYYKNTPEIIKKGNAGGTREHLYWSVYESSRGNRSLDNFRKAGYLDAVLEHDSNIIILGVGNINYGWDGTVIPKWKENDTKLDAWYNYCFNIASDLKGVIDRFEIWNEPVIFNTNKKYNADFDTAADYVKLLEVAYRAVKDANPDAKVGGISHCGLQDATFFKWFAEVLRLGGAQYMDAFTLHPYGSATGSMDVTNMIDLIEKHLAEFEKYGKTRDNLELWYTEYGCTLTDVNFDETHVGNMITKSYVHAKSLDRMDVMSMYDLVQDGIIPEEREHNFGILRNHKYSLNKVNLSATKAFPIVTQMNYILAQAEPEKIVKYNDDVNVYLYKSNKFNKDVAVLWTKSNPQQVNLDLGADEVTVYDCNGNSTKVVGVEGKFTFPAHESCYYIIGDFKRCKRVENQLVEIENISLNGAVNDTVYVSYKNNTGKNISAEFGKIASNIEVLENDSSKGIIVLKLPNTSGEGSVVRVNFTSDGKIIQSTDFDISYNDKVGTSINTELYIENNYDKWLGKVRIENYSRNYNVNGYIKFKSPTSFAVLDKIPTGPIPAGKTAEVEISLPEIKKKGMMYIDYDIVLNDGSVINCQGARDFTLAVKAKSTPKIDGVMNKDEWVASTAMYSENPEQIKQIQGYGGVDDLSAKTYIAWDKENYYMAVEVTDNVFCQESLGADIWRGDSVQFGIVVAPEQETVVFGQSSVTFSEIGMALTSEGPLVWRWSAEDSQTHKTGKITNADCSVARNGNKTVYELRIPWSEIIPGGGEINPQRPLGFSMLVNDNDGSGRRGWIEYASGIGQTKDSRLFTYLKLVE